MESGDESAKVMKLERKFTSFRVRLVQKERATIKISDKFHNSKDKILMQLLQQNLITFGAESVFHSQRKQLPLSPPTFLSLLGARPAIATGVCHSARLRAWEAVVTVTASEGH